MYSAQDIIRAARRERGWSQRDLADQASVTQPNLSAYESGQRVPSLAMLRRLARACGLQIRFDLEPLWTDVDGEVAQLLDLPPDARLGRQGEAALYVIAALSGGGAELVLDDLLAARILGAPVADSPARAWCRLSDLDQLRAAAKRFHRDVVPVRPRYADDADYQLVYADGDELKIGEALITLGDPPPARWSCRTWNFTVPVVDIDLIRDRYRWWGADRLAVERLTLIVERDGRVNGLDPYP
jgi:transcriptional regulator with XRE-family HTH domain